MDRVMYDLQGLFGWPGEWEQTVCSSCSPGGHPPPLQMSGSSTLLHQGQSIKCRHSGNTMPVSSVERRTACLHVEERSAPLSCCNDCPLLR